MVPCSLSETGGRGCGGQRGSPEEDWLILAPARVQSFVVVVVVVAAVCVCVCGFCAVARDMMTRVRQRNSDLSVGMVLPCALLPFLSGPRVRACGVLAVCVEEIPLASLEEKGREEETLRKVQLQSEPEKSYDTILLSFFIFSPPTTYVFSEFSETKGLQVRYSTSRARKAD